MLLELSPSPGLRVLAPGQPARRHGLPGFGAHAPEEVALAPLASDPGPEPPGFLVLAPGAGAPPTRWLLPFSPQEGGGYRRGPEVPLELPGPLHLAWEARREAWVLGEGGPEGLVRRFDARWHPLGSPPRPRAPRLRLR